VSDLGAILGPDLVAAIERLVDERIDAALAVERANVKRWLNVGEAAAYLGCSPKAIYARIDRGRIPPAAVRRSGRSVLLDRVAIDRDLDS
jgi:excisionase family DNA binding protein